MTRRLAACTLAAALCSCVPRGAGFDPIDLVMPSFTDEEEREIGFAFDRELREQVEVIDDPLVAGFLDDLGLDVLAQVGPQPFVYRFRVIRNGSLNAFAVFGGYVYFHSGTLLAASSLDELAGVMGHEIAHVRLRHHEKLRQRAQLPDLVATLGGLAAAVVTGEDAILLASQGVNVALQLRFSREFEAESDREGTRYMAAAGYDPRGIARFFQRLLDQRGADPQHVPPYLFSHPDVELRLVAVEVYAKDARTRPREPGELDRRFRAAQSRLATLAAADRGHADADRQAARSTPARDAAPAAAPRAHFEAGEAAMAAGDPAAAVVQYQRVIALDPSRALVFLRLGEAYEALGRREKAVFAYEQAEHRAGARGALRQRALQAVERLSFTVLEQSELAASRDGSELVWRGQLGPRFRARSERMQVRWLDPEGTALADAPVAARGDAVEARLALPPDAAGERWTAVVLLDEHEVERRSEVLPGG